MSDPQTILKNALGAAYSSSIAGTPRNEIVNGLRSLIASDEIKPIAQNYLANLAAIVAARSVGNRAGCVISQLQLSLLEEAVS